NTPGIIHTTSSVRHGSIIWWSLLRKPSMYFSTTFLFVVIAIIFDGQDFFSNRRTTPPGDNGSVDTSLKFVPGVPDLNKRVPLPRMTGAIPMRYSSKRSVSISVRERSALPHTYLFFPSWAFNLEISSGTPPVASVALFHPIAIRSAGFKVVEKTSLGRLFISRAISLFSLSAFFQYAAIPS